MEDAMTWQSMNSAPKGIPILVWDDYYLMRIAKWNSMTGNWVTDLPYDCERGGKELPLNPVCWQPCPPLPDHVNGVRMVLA